MFYKNLYIKFYKIIKIVSKWKQIQGCTTTHSKPNIALMGKKKEKEREKKPAIRLTIAAKLCYFR
jgi:hypothetical protein